MLRQFPDVPILVERDANFGAFAELHDETTRLRQLRPGRRSELPRSAPATAIDSPFGSAALATALSELAAVLTDRAPPSGALAERIGVPDLERTRAVLSRKRVDDALPLLGRLSRRGDELRAIADRAIEAAVRPPSGAGPADALRIAEAAAEVAGLRDDAVFDRLLLRARFAAPDARGVVAPRFAPFVGTEKLRDGTRLRAFKGFGAFASVHVEQSRKEKVQPCPLPAVNPSTDSPHP